MGRLSPRILIVALAFALVPAGGAEAATRHFSVTLASSATTLYQGQEVTLSGRVAPQAPGYVKIQTYRSGAWATVKRVRLSASSRYRTLVRVNKLGTSRWRSVKMRRGTRRTGISQVRSLQTVLPLAVGTERLGRAVTGYPYSQQLVATGGLGPYEWSAADLPAGLELTLDGVLTGNPVEPGNSSIVVTVKDAVNHAGTRTLELSRVLPWRSITTGNGHTCAIRSDRTAWCWGHNDYGQLGDGSFINRRVPVQVGSDSDWLSVSANAGVGTCAVKTDGTAWCWGNNVYGGLGDGTTENKPTPVQVGMDSNWKSVTAGQVNSCGLRTDGTAWCWGDNNVGQLGPDTSTFLKYPTPRQVGTDTDWESLTVGGSNMCGIRTGGSGWCWGYNYHGQLGGDIPAREPKPVLAGGSEWSNLAIGNSHICGVTTPDGYVGCWGWNQDGQAGSGTNEGVLWSTVVAGYGHTCALNRESQVMCWGLNDFGQLGDGSTLSHPDATHVGEGRVWSDISAGGWHTCGLSQGAAYCWGRNDGGELGNGSSEARTVQPVLVAARS